ADRSAGVAHVRVAGRLSARVGRRGARATTGDPVLRARDGDQGGRGLRARPGRDDDHEGASRRRPVAVGLALPGRVLMVIFRIAARVFQVYGFIYWLGGFYLALQGVGVRGDRMMQPGVAWIIVGLVLVVAIPYLLARRRAWFERWILSRRDFARIL